MAERAAARKAEREAPTWDEKAYLHSEALWAAFVDEREGFHARLERPTSTHAGHYVHSHYFHGNAMWCSCGQMAGIFSIALTDHMPPTPTECPVCRDLPDFLERADVLVPEGGEPWDMVQGPAPAAATARRETPDYRMQFPVVVVIELPKV